MRSFNLLLPEGIGFKASCPLNELAKAILQSNKAGVENSNVS
jgi:hypothetical protein